MWKMGYHTHRDVAFLAVFFLGFLGGGILTGAVILLR